MSGNDKKRRAAGLALMLALVFAADLPAARAQNCTPLQKPDARQKAQLEKLPAPLRSILAAVQSRKKAFCALSGSAVAIPFVDPDASVLNFAPLGEGQGRQVANQVNILVKGKDGDIARIAARHRLTVRSQRNSQLLGGVLVTFVIADGRSVAQVLRALRTDPKTGIAAPEHIYELMEGQGGKDLEAARFAPDMMGLGKLAQGVTGRSVRIAIIDTAIDFSHESLKQSIALRFDALPGQPVFDRQHGTSVAGLIAGRRMIKGVAPEAKLLVARAFDRSGQGEKALGTTSTLLAALDWAVGNGAQIINMSFAGPHNRLLSQALARASKRGILLVAAVGNNGADAAPAYPAADPWVLAVTAIDAAENIYPQANQGAHVFIAAPGVDILAPFPDQGVDMVTGTSFAAPFISGIAALIMQVKPDLAPRAIALRLKASARDLGAPGRDRVFGAGLVQAAKAVGRTER